MADQLRYVNVPGGVGVGVQTLGYNPMGFVRRLNNSTDQFTLTMNWVYFIIKVIIAIVTILSVVLFILVSVGMFTYDGPDFRVYLTNTYYTTPDTEPNVTWQILSIPAVDSQSRPTNPYSDIKFEHFYECIWIANISVACGSYSNVNDYTTCVKASAQSTPLDTCATNNNIGLAWPTASSYANCVNNVFGGNRRSLGVLKTCVKIRPWPMYEVPQDIDSPFFLGSFSWPMLMITGFGLFLAFGIYTLYPVDFEDVTVIEYGKPMGHWGMSRLGLVWTLVPLLVTAGWSAVCILIAFRAGSTWPNANVNPYPSTQTTNVLVLSASVAALVYFLLELSEFFDRSALANPAKADQPTVPPAPGDVETARSSFFTRTIPISLVMGQSGYQQGVAPGGSRMGYYFPDVTKSVDVGSIKEAAQQYAPVLIRTWADAYLFDVLFIVGALGATQQLQTAEVYNIFWGLVYYRVAHMGMVRMIYESYVRAPFEDRSTAAIKDKGISAPGEGETKKSDASLCMKVNALAMHFAAFCALYLVLGYTSSANRMIVEFDAAQDLIMYGIIVPEVLRAFGHLYLLLRTPEMDGAKAINLLVFTHFIWMWDVAVRGLFVYLYFYGAVGYQGTKPFLLDQLNVLNTTLVKGSAVW